MTLTDQYFKEKQKPLFLYPRCVFMPDERNFKSKSGHRFHDLVIIGKELRKWGVWVVEVVLVRFRPSWLREDIILAFRVDNGLELSDNPWYKLEFWD